MSEDGVQLLRDLADELESQQAVAGEAITLLRQLTAACPWELDAGGSPAFWLAMRKSQRLLKVIDDKGYRAAGGEG